MIEVRKLPTRREPQWSYKIKGHCAWCRMEYYFTPEEALCKALERIDGGPKPEHKDIVNVELDKKLSELIKKTDSKKHTKLPNGKEKASADGIS